MTTINEAFKAHGLKAEYEGMAAVVLPVTAELAADLDQSKIAQGVGSGQMLLSWNDGEKRNGKVIHADARTDVTILIPRNDGEDLRVSAKRMTDAALTLLTAQKASIDDIARVDRKNTKAVTKYEEATTAFEAAGGRGDVPKEPKVRVAEFDADAFTKVATFVTCVKESQLAIKADPLADIAAKAAADGFTGKMRNLTRNDLTSAQKVMADEARTLKAEIAMLSPEHKDAAAGFVPAAYEGDREAARDMMASLPNDPQGISAAQNSAMAQNPDMNLVNRLFSVATTTPVMQVEKRALSHAGFKTFAQELVKHVNKDAADTILPRMAAVTTDAMEGYKWGGQVYTKDGADILLMRDEYAAFAYAWDSESRVGEINVEATVLQNLTAEDVPTKDELEALRATVEELRHNNGAEVNFDWDDEPEEDAVFEA
jgi:hypothetical protein